MTENKPESDLDKLVAALKEHGIPYRINQCRSFSRKQSYLTVIIETHMEFSQKGKKH